MVGKDNKGCRVREVGGRMSEEEHEPKCGLGIRMTQWSHKMLFVLSC